MILTDGKSRTIIPPPPPPPTHTPLLLCELHSHVDTAVQIKSMCLDHGPDKKLALMKRKLRLILNMTGYHAYDQFNAQIMWLDVSEYSRAKKLALELRLKSY